MGVVGGIDEAGYGPTLGPLVVSLAAFRVPVEVGFDRPPCDLWSGLGEEAVLRNPPPRASSSRDKVPQGESRRAGLDERLVVCDSKKLYRQGKGLRSMEETALAFLSLAAGEAPSGEVPGGIRLSALVRGLCERPERLDPYPWYCGRDVDLPLYSFRSIVRKKSEALARACARSAIQTLHLRPRIVHALEFNEGVRAEGNKHRLEWRIVSDYLRLLFERYGEEGVEVTCDKLGGRSFYGPLVARLFPRARMTAPLETPERSLYRVTQGPARMTIGFVEKADERSFPVALASIFSKYLREIYVRLLNEFFAERIPGLRRTAGYPEDARRFLAEVRPELERLSVAEEVLARCC